VTDGTLPPGSLDPSVTTERTGAIFTDNTGGVNVANTGFIGGDVVITSAAVPPYLIEPFPAAPVLDPLRLSWLLEQPSRLLDARSQVVPFAGRSRELEDLASWRDAAGGILSVRLLHGPGGQGKTRLAARFAELSAKAGWQVSVARQTGDLTNPADDLTGRHLPDAARGLLLVVDYADRWSHTELLRLFADPLLRLGAPVRVLLLGRSVQWWPAMRGELAEVHARTDDQLLRHLADTVQARGEVFNAARDRFAQLLRVERPERITPPGPLSEASYGLVLTVHMAALVSVDAAHHGNQPPTGPQDLSAYLLDRERMNWRRLYGSRVSGEEFATAPSVMARAVFTAVLTGPMRHTMGTATLGKLELEHPQQVLTDHRVCYPPSDRATVLEPLYPDRLAEDFLALLLPGHDVSGYDPDPWAADTPARLLARNPDRQLPVYTPRTITFLAAAAGPDRWNHLAAYLNTILHADPALAIAAGSAALAAVAEIPAIDMAVLEAIDAQLPEHRQIDLDPGIAALTQRIAEHHLAFAVTDDQRAWLHGWLGGRLSNAGRREEALAATRAAVEIRRRMAAGVGDQDLGLAEALVNFGIMLAEAGRRPEAEAAAEEAVKIFRHLATADPADHEPGLATSLINYGRTLAGQGRHEEALAATDEAVEIYRRLAAADPADHEPGLAGSLINLGGTLAGLGRHEEALAATGEAVEIYRRLAAADPGAFEPGLAMSLNNHGNWLAKLGRHAEAVAVTQAAADICRHLAAANPGAFEPSLAMALTSVGNWLARQGRYEEALTPGAEAVEIYRRLAATSTLAFEPDLAMSLNNLGNRLAALGRYQEATSAASEAADIYRRLAASSPLAFEADLAMSLNNLGKQLSALGRLTEALAATQAATEIRRRLAAANPGARNPDLASALSNLSEVLAKLGRREEALAAEREAAEILLPLAAATPDAYDQELARALGNLGSWLSGSGHWQEGLTASQSSVQILRRLAQANPTAHEHDLAMSLNNLGNRFAELGRIKDALDATEEAVQIRRRLAQANPGSYEPDLAMSLSNLGNWLSKSGRHQEALAATEEAVTIRAGLAVMDPGAYRLALARGLRIFASVRVAGGLELPQALSAAQLSVTIFDQLAQRLPGAFAAELRATSDMLAEIIDQLGRAK